jgi:hypothetical protein
MPSPHIAPAAVEVTVLLVVEPVVDVVEVVVEVVVVPVVEVLAPPWLDAVEDEDAPPEPSVPVASPKRPSVSTLHPVTEATRTVARPPRPATEAKERPKNARHEAMRAT